AGAGAVGENRKSACQLEQGSQILWAHVRRRAEAQVPASALHQLLEVAAVERITGPLAEALARHREACNDKFAAATRKGGELDATAFLEHLAATVDPIVRSVAGLFAERAEMAA